MNTAVQSVQREKWWKDKDHTEKFKEDYTIGQGTLRKGTDRKEDQYPFLLRSGNSDDRSGLRMKIAAAACKQSLRHF